MKIFDSLKDKNWSGLNFEIKKNSIYVLKSANLKHAIKLKPGKYSLKIIGKKRIGSGKLYIEVTDDDNLSLLKKELNFSNNMLSEHGFNFEVPKDLGDGLIKVFRDKNTYGSVEIARVILDLDVDTQKIFEKELTPIKKNFNTDYLNNMFKFNERKNFAFIVPYNMYGGAEVYIQNIINEISNNQQITVFYFGENYLQNQISNNSVQHRVVKNIEQLKALLKTLNFDYIIYYNRADIYQNLIDLKFNKEIKSNLIEIFHSEFKWSGSISNLKERRDIDKFITVANGLEKNIIGVENIFQTIPVGIYLDKFKKTKNKLFNELELHNYKGVIGTVSRLSKEKNIDYVINIAEKMNDFGFVIVGSGPEEKRLREIIKLRKIKNIHLVGFKKNVEEYYNIFDAFILNSKIEGTPISILESMASKTPVFVNPVGFIPFIVKNNETGFYLSQDEDKDIKLLKNNINNIDVIENAYNYVIKNHDIKNIAQDFLRAIMSERKLFIENNNFENILLPGIYI